MFSCITNVEDYYFDDDCPDWLDYRFETSVLVKTPESGKSGVEEDVKGK